ncbi:hypothetical protein Ahy_A06g028955 [Arachis hypogaea]|uniref:Protein FAR1-RELATED SEQUENCE n=1 Tax=Arachis hypogaea TaxID=3818 RepID=A0A445CS23_ARAHY|nr:hypothetical protein Ahy_A06g028955 [Arachis hypogaea]
MESNWVEPVYHVPSSFTDDNFTHSINNLLNPCDVEDEQSNKVSNKDHSFLGKDEILRVGMQFEHLKLAQKFYARYAKKVNFVSKIQTTIFDKMAKEPINQAIHCNREGFCRSHVKAPKRKNTVVAVQSKDICKVWQREARLDLVEGWVETITPLFNQKVVHYHEYRELTMHAKCVIDDNDEAGIRLNKTFLALANEGEFWIAMMMSMEMSESMHVFYDEFLHSKTSLVQFIHEVENVLGNKKQQKLEDDAANSRGVISCATSSAIERQFQQKVPSYYVLPRWSKNIKCKYTYIKSIHDVRYLVESHNFFRGLCTHFYNVAQEFVNGDDEAAILHAVLDNARAKLVDYRAKL